MSDTEARVLYTVWYTYEDKRCVLLERYFQPSKVGRYLDRFEGLMGCMWYACPTEYYNNNLK